jgi:hypothetical protein
MEFKRGRSEHVGLSRAWDSIPCFCFAFFATALASGTYSNCTRHKSNPSNQKVEKMKKILSIKGLNHYEYKPC